MEGEAPVRAGALLARAAELYDAPDSPLPAAARKAARGGFAGGAEWMRLVLGAVRGEALEPIESPGHYHFLGLTKYTLAGAAALGGAVGAIVLGAWPLAVLAVPLFYAVEAQGVFLFPLALDGETRPFRVARRWTV